MKKQNKTHPSPSKESLRNKFLNLMPDEENFTADINKKIAKNPDFLIHFNTPIHFLVIIALKHKSAFNFIMKHILGIPPQQQKAFTDATNSKNRNALILASRLNFTEALSKLLRLNFNLDLKDTRNHTALHYLIEHNNFTHALTLLNKEPTLDSAELESLAEKTKQLDLGTQKSRKEWGKSLTQQVGAQQAGRIPKAFPQARARPYRSFTAERERQLLKHISTQLYFYLKEAGPAKNNLTEVQTMHLAYGDNHSLFIAVNQYTFSTHLSSLLNTKDKFKKVLCKNHRDKNKKSEETFRAKRYANKLAHRVFGDEIKPPESSNFNDQQRTEQVTHLLRDAKFYALPFSDNKEKNRNTITHCVEKLKNSIFLVVVKDSKFSTMRHAEEFLCDIADVARDSAKKRNITFYSSIGGKKRPCAGCSGRMESSEINTYSKNLGLFWQHTIEHQSASTAAKTLPLLCTQRPNLSLSKDGTKRLTEFDSGSDTEDEITLSM